MGNSKMREPGKRAEFPFAVLLVFLLVFSVAASVHAAEKKAEKPVEKTAKVEKKETKEAVVLMPMRATKDIPQDEMTQYEAALVKSLSEKYVVYSGQRVMEKVNDVYKKRSSEAQAGKECDETKCLQDIAIAFQTELVAVANIRKSGGGYSISLAINDVAEDKSVFADSVPCEGCNEFEVIRQLKMIVGGSAPVAQAAAPAPAKAAPSVPAGMAAIPAGEFWMGSSDADLDWVGRNWNLNDAIKKLISAEQPRHRVRLSGFFMDKYEVTNKQFEEFVRQTGYQTDAEKGGSGYVFTDKWEDTKGAYWREPNGPGSGYEGGDYPVVQVSWNDAAAYCKGVGKRLPTEAEWEYAAKGGHDWRYPWGNEKPGNNQANFADVSSGLGHADKNVNDGYRRLSPVGNYPANDYGLYDMAGNAQEWVADWYDGNYYKQSPADDPKGPSSGSEKVLRGGSWFPSALNLRAASRNLNDPGLRYSFIGFRCAQY